MGKFIGALLFLVGLGLLTLALFVPPLLFPQTTGQVVWRSSAWRATSWPVILAQRDS